MRAFRLNLIFWEQSTIVLGTVAVLSQLHL